MKSKDDFARAAVIDEQMHLGLERPRLVGGDASQDVTATGWERFCLVRMLHTEAAIQPSALIEAEDADRQVGVVVQFQSGLMLVADGE